MIDKDFLDQYKSDFSRFYIINLLYEGPQHGYSIIQLFKERLGKDISSGIVYPFLKQLEEKKIISFEMKPVGDKTKKVFQLTEEGKIICEQMFRRFAGIVSTAIDSTIKVCVHCGCKIFEGGHTEEIGGKSQLFCCKHCASSYKRILKETGEKPLFG